MITGTASDPSPISQWLAGLFVRVSDTNSYPILVSIYSAVLGLFVPSGGSKWVIEAPYLLQAANELKVNLGWVVQMYNAAEALPNRSEERRVGKEGRERGGRDERKEE